jgi:hypothetical protein
VRWLLLAFTFEVVLFEGKLVVVVVVVVPDEGFSMLRATPLKVRNKGPSVAPPAPAPFAAAADAS